MIDESVPGNRGKASKPSNENLTQNLKKSKERNQSSMEWLAKNKRVLEEGCSKEANSFFGKSSGTMQEEEDLNSSGKLNSNSNTVINSLKNKRGLQTELLASHDFSTNPPFQQVGLNDDREC